MTTNAMSKEKGAPPPPEADVTTVKCYKNFQKLVRQLGAILDLNQPDVLARYYDHVEDDLLREMAKMQARKKGPRPGQ